MKNVVKWKDMNTIKRNDNVTVYQVAVSLCYIYSNRNNVE